METVLFKGELVKVKGTDNYVTVYSKKNRHEVLVIQKYHVTELEKLSNRSTMADSDFKTWFNQYSK